MMRVLKSLLKNRIVATTTLVIFLFTNVVFSSDYIFDDLSIGGPVVVMDNNIVVTGDSFAGKFCEYESNKDLRVTPFARAGMTVIANAFIMAEAMDYSHIKYVLISIGVNDQFNETPPYLFESNLRFILNHALVNNKYVIMHSYLKYFAPIYDSKKYSAIIYDNVIRRVCNEYDNVVYIDCKDLETPEYISDDTMHYNSKFYDKLYNRVFREIVIYENMKH